MTVKLHQLTIHQLHDLLVKKEVTSREATEALYRRISEVDKKIKAYLLLTEKEAFVQADQVDGKIARGEEIGDLARRPDRAERYPLYKRDSDDLRL